MKTITFEFHDPDFNVRVVVWEFELVCGQVVLGDYVFPF